MVRRELRVIAVDVPRTVRRSLEALSPPLVQLAERVGPGIVVRPLPLRTQRSAAVAVTITAAASAAVDELEALALLVPGADLVLIPAAPVVATTAVAALAFEAYAAASLRVHLVERAGKAVDPATVVGDALRAMAGRPELQLTRAGSRMVGRRIARRWVRGMTPFVGIVLATWDARRTIGAIARMPV